MARTRLSIPFTGTESTNRWFAMMHSDEKRRLCIEQINPPSLLMGVNHERIIAFCLHRTSGHFSRVLSGTTQVKMQTGFAYINLDLRRGSSISTNCTFISGFRERAADFASFAALTAASFFAVDSAVTLPRPLPFSSSCDVCLPALAWRAAFLFLSARGRLVGFFAIETLLFGNVTRAGGTCGWKKRENYRTREAVKLCLSLALHNFFVFNSFLTTCIL